MTPPDASRPGDQFGETAARSHEIDVWRGLAIVLVVLGHAVQTTVPLFDQNWLFRGIYAFHMPLFFFISGVVSLRGLSRPLLAQLKSRSLGLVVPFISWYVLVQLGYWLFTGGEPIGVRLQLLFLSVDRGLWFLWVLFLASMAAALVLRIPRVPRFAALLGASVVFLFIPWSIAGLALFKYYFPFFAAGLLVSPDVLESGLFTRWRRWEAAVLPVAFVLLLLGWTRVGFTAPAEYWHSLGLRAPAIIDYSYRYLTAGVGIAASLVIVSFVPIESWLGRSFRYLGTQTLEIYVSHELFLIPFAGIGLIWAPFVAVVAGAAALLTSRVLKPLAPLRILLYGGRR